MEHQSLRPLVGVASLSSPLEVGAERAGAAAETLKNILEDAGCTTFFFGSITTADEAVRAGRKAAEEHIEAVAFVPVCWYEDYYVLDFIEECSVPVFLWPLPGMETGALCGAQQQTLFLKKLGYPYEAVFGTLEDAECLKKGMSFLRAAALTAKLRRARIGFAGQRVLGMTDTAVDEHMLKKAVGPRVVPLAVPGILEEAKRETASGDVGELWRELRAKAGRTESADEDGILSVSVYRVLKELAEENGLNALTVGCYPDLMGIVCLAASLLADDGIPMACEGDVNGAVGMLMLYLLSGTPVHSTDWLDPMEDGTVVFTHCGSGSFDLAETAKDVELCPVRLMDRGVCARFPAKPGPVTLISMDPRPEGYRCAVLEGEAVHTDMVFPGNPVRVRFRQKTEDLIQWIFDEGLAHHWMIGYGHFLDDIRNWGKIAGPSVSVVGPPAV
jgi:L-fucose isomerase-like protein